MKTPDEFADRYGDTEDSRHWALRDAVAARDAEWAAQLTAQPTIVEFTALANALAKQLDESVAAAHAAGRLEGWDEAMEDAKTAAIAFGKKYPLATPRGIANAIDSVKIAGPERIPVNGCEEGAVKRG